MFVTVRYGADQTKIFNADCKNEVLLENIKLHCDCNDSEVVEVSDELGVVKNLRNFPSEYGSDFLKGRETLVLLQVQNGRCSADKPVYTPLVASLRNDPEFNENLNREMDLDQLMDPNSSFSRRQQQQHQLQHQQTSLDADEDPLNKSFKGKAKTSSTSSLNSNPPAGGGKKSILKRNAKNTSKK